jgi:tryptophan synthase alpha chain
LALDFGVKGKSDVDYLEKKTDIAVSGTETIKILENGGIGTKGEFIRDWA